jgi:acyl-CoA synthetase (AMP-forming)/AMP-acid ligase II
MKSTSPPGSFQVTSCFLPLAESMPEGTISAVCCLNAHPSLNLRHVGEFVDALPMTTTRRILRHELRNAERAKLAD